MKQQKLDGYAPKYPKRAVKGAALAAAALVALGTATGCRFIRPETTGIVPIEEPTPIEDVQLEGYMMPEETPVEETMTMGLILSEPTPDPEEVMLSGDVLVIDDMP